MTKTGMKAPQGTGMVVASADIQNCGQEVVQTGRSPRQAPDSPQLYQEEPTLLIIHQAQIPSSPRIPPEVKEGQDSRTRWLRFKSHSAISLWANYVASLCLDFPSLGQGY